MTMLNKWKEVTGRWNLGKNLRDTFDSFSAVLHRHAEGESEKRIRFAFQSLVCRLLQKEGFIPRKNREIYQGLLEDKYDRRTAEDLMERLLSMTPLPPEEAVAVLQTENKEQKRHFLEFLLSLAVAVGDEEPQIAFLQDLAKQFQVEWEPLETLHATIRENEERKKRIVSSGIGVIAALVVLLVFVITAKLLLPVVFGLIFACILLPVEKFFEKQVQKKSSFSYWLTVSVNFLLYPLHKISALLRRKDRLSTGEDPSLRQLKMRKKRIVRATFFTSLSLILLLLILGLGISKLTGRYVRTMQDSVLGLDAGKNKTLSPLPEENRSNHALWCDHCLEWARKHFESMPMLKQGIEMAKKELSDPMIRKKILTALWGGADGVFSLTADVLGSTVSFLCNLLLTFFFTLLFLMKLAEFCQDDNSDKQKSEYLIRMMFNGIWLPDADETVIREARRIIEGVFFRLRVWLRGYLTLVAVDASVYTVLFGILDVPFFLPLGLLAGCGILLPYIGPVISCAVTLIVTFAAGSGSGFMLMAIIVCYLCYNGVVEQFILYPAVIGESLGLSTLETIIVVLLGAIFAGIPGMILALPVASVAKYIIPQCYRSFLDPGKLKKRAL